MPCGDSRDNDSGPLSNQRSRKSKVKGFGQRGSATIKEVEIYYVRTGFRSLKSTSCFSELLNSYKLFSGKVKPLRIIRDLNRYARFVSGEDKRTHPFA